jgi:NADH:ubiquinone oxidoreductase subunit 3 (subunit A)
MSYPVINPTIITLFIFLPVLILILLGLNLLLAPFNPDPEKTTSFECGFSPIYGQTRNPFHIQFYLVAILFLIFDLEIFFLVPLSVSLNKISFYGFSIFCIFFLILTIGFIYELGHKILDFSHDSLIEKNKNSEDQSTRNY